MGRFTGDFGGDDNWLKGPVQYILPPFLLLDYAREPAVVAYVERAVKHDAERGFLRNATWVPWEGIFEYLANVEYARYCLQAKDDESELLVLYHSRALVFFAQATLDLIAAWLRKHLELSTRGGDTAFHKHKFQRELASKSEDFARLIDGHRDFVKELADYRLEWIHRVPGRPILTLHEDRASRYTVPIDPTETIYNYEGLSDRRERATKRHGRSSYDIQEFAQRLGVGTSKLLLKALMASLRHPDIEDAPGHV